MLLSVGHRCGAMVFQLLNSVRTYIPVNHTGSFDIYTGCDSLKSVMQANSLLSTVRVLHCDVQKGESGTTTKTTACAHCSHCCYCSDMAYSSSAGKIKPYRI
jgi:hypothetical protein